MPKAAFCSECGTYVWIARDGGCVSGHPRSCLRGECDLPQDPMTGTPLLPVQESSSASVVVSAKDALVDLNHGVWQYVSAQGHRLQAHANRLRTANEMSSDDPVTVSAAAPEVDGSQSIPASATPAANGWVRVQWFRHRRWQPARAWLTALLAWLAATIGADLLAAAEPYRDTGSTEAGWVVLVTLVVCGICAFTTWQPWPTWQRFAFLGLVWLSHTFIEILVGLPVAFVAVIGDSADLASRLTALVASIPLVVISMRQSRLFTRAKPVDQGA